MWIDFDERIINTDNFDDCRATRFNGVPCVMFSKYIHINGGDRYIESITERFKSDEQAQQRFSQIKKLLGKQYRTK